MKNLKAQILEQIEENKLKPKPKWLFLFKSLALGISVIFIFIFAFYVLAFLGFVISERDWIQEGTFTLTGLYFLFNTMPLAMIIFSIFMILIASVTAYKYGLSYKKPFLYTLLFILIILLGSRYIFVASGAQQYIKEEAFKRKIQLVPSSWKDLRDKTKAAQINF